MADQTNMIAIDRTLNHGIRILHTAGPTKTTWCIHCNHFLPNDDPYNPDKHASLCPYAAIAALGEEAKALGELQDACIKRYCGMTGPDEWREAVRKSPEGQRLIAIAATQSEQVPSGE